MESVLGASTLPIGQVRDLRSASDAEIIRWYGLVHEFDQFWVRRSFAQKVLLDPLPPVIKAASGKEDSDVLAQRSKDAVESRTVSLLAGRADVKTVDLPQGGGRHTRPMEVVGIPLQPGFHIVEVSSARLGKALLDPRYGPQRRMTVRTAALVTNHPRLRAADGHRSLWQKWRQMATAVALERQWNKDQILEAYLNIVPFRGEVVGVDALGRDLFGKAPHALDRQEAAIAAALIRAPNASAKQVAVRACTLLRAGDRADGHHTPAFCAGLRVRITQLFAAHGFAPSQGIAFHFARRLLRAAGSPAPIVLISTLDRRIQRVAYENLRQALLELEGRHVYDSAAVVIDNASGDVLAWVGAVDASSSAPEVDSVQAPRQPGSALKPLLDDIPTEIPTAAGLYIPENYDHRFRGWISVRTALAASLNIPAVRTLVMLGPDHFAESLDRIGIHLRETGGYYGYSLALGSAEVTLLELANAYRTLANGGRSSPVRLQPDDPRQPSAPVSTTMPGIKPAAKPPNPMPPFPIRPPDETHFSRLQISLRHPG
ncbi:transglycosylase domain-containing protein, partial [Acidithiobacillus sp.]|uniref:transglycosylase domain-containing protein n=1 Tax=Acidithiobacillus sp. TaxID=1872118 RepID=UPI003D0618C5